MITRDDEGNLVFSMDSRYMDTEDLISHYLSMNDDEFDTAFDALTMMTDAWNDASECRLTKGEKGAGH